MTAATLFVDLASGYFFTGCYGCYAKSHKVTIFCKWKTWVEKIGDLSPKKHDEPHKKSILFFKGGNQSQDPKATQIRDCVSVLTNHKMVLDIHLPTGMKISNWNFISQHCRTQSHGWFIIRWLSDSPTWTHHPGSWWWGSSSSQHVPPRLQLVENCMMTPLSFASKDSFFWFQSSKHVCYVWSPQKWHDDPSFQM